jgi:hypothetical protein
MSELLQNLMKVYVAQISSAMVISEIITDHSDEEEITPDFLITGLIYRLMTPMTTEEINGSLESASELIKDIYNDGSDAWSDTADIGSDTSDIEDIVLERTPRKIKMNTCDCIICSQARACIRNYYTHQCNDQLSEKFKDSITHTCQQHNLLI